MAPQYYVFLHADTDACSYVAGYASSGAASNFSVVLVSTAATNEVVTTLYSSPALSNYSYDNFTGYSPPVQVNHLRRRHHGAIVLPPSPVSVQHHGAIALPPSTASVLRP